MPVPDPISGFKFAAAIAGHIRRWLRRAMPVHRALYSGTYTNNYSNRRDLYMVVACAPSRSFRRPRAIQPRSVHAFLESVFPRSFDAQPTESYGDVVAFSIPGADPNNSWEVRADARIRSNGCVEFLIRIPLKHQVDGKLVVPLLDFLTPAYTVMDTVRLGGYKNLFQLRSRVRRLDWCVALGNSVTMDPGGWKPWDDISFPAVRPEGRASTAFPAAPTAGFAPRQLLSRRQRAEPENLIRPALADLLEKSGWYGSDAAIESTLEALRAAVASHTFSL